MAWQYNLDLQTHKAHFNQTVPDHHFWLPKMSSSQLCLKTLLGLQPLTALEAHFLLKTLPSPYNALVIFILKHHVPEAAK